MLQEVRIVPSMQARLDAVFAGSASFDDRIVALTALFRLMHFFALENPSNQLLMGSIVDSLLGIMQRSAGGLRNNAFKLIACAGFLLSAFVFSSFAHTLNSATVRCSDKGS